MNRIGLPLGLAALLVSFSAPAVRVPTGSDDINLNVNAFLQARYEGTFEGSVEKSLDSDFFLRRARIQVSGTAYKTLSFLIQTDNSQMGKRGTPASIGNGANGAAGTPAFVQDLVIGWTPIEDFTLEMGLLLTPTSRILGYSASGGQVQIEAPIDIIFQNLDRGFRQNGAEARGFLLARRIHYRAGVWEGFHSAAAVPAVVGPPAVAATPAVNPGGKPMIGAHVRLNLIGEETGYAFNAMYLDGKPRASIGGSVQYQPRAACAGATSACSLVAGTSGVTGSVNDYKFFGGDAFVDMPLPGDLEFSADAGIFRWDYGDANARTGTGYAGSLNFRAGVIGAFLSAYKYGSDSGNVHTSDRRKLAAGLTWFIKGQADKVTLELNGITPGAPGNPAAVAPVASNTGLQNASTTTAIWLQGQAGF